MTIFGAILFASVILTSCADNSIQNDAKKYAELMCKAQELAKKAATGDMSAIAESTKLATEVASHLQEVKEKYKDAEYSKYLTACSEEMVNCK